MRSLLGLFWLKKMVAGPEENPRTVVKMLYMKHLVATTIAALMLLPAAGTPAVAAPAVPVAGAFNPVSIDQNKTRIFMPLKNVKVLKKASGVSTWVMEVSSDSSSLYLLERGVSMGPIHKLRIQTFEGRTYIKADWRYAAPVTVKVRPGGLEVIFQHKQLPPQFNTIATGVKYWEGQRWTGAGPIRVRALRLDPEKVRLEPVVATSGNHMGLAPVSHLARRAGAIAAINGGFFAPRTGEPQGTLVVHHNLVSRTMLNRPSFWVKKDGSAFIQTVKPGAVLKLEDGTPLTINGVNETAQRNRTTLYTAHYGRTSRTVPDPSRWEYAIDQAGQVVAEGNGNLAIPAGGYVVSGQGKSYFDLRKWIGLGQAVKVAFGIDPAIQHGMGGGPVIMQKGAVKVLTANQRFQADVVRSRAPRTAIGILRDGSYMLVTIDGHRPGYSVGATLTELGNTMKGLGVVEAMNLDGGGSTTMWVKGRVANRPSDGRERAVSNALLVLPRDRQVASALYGMLAANLAY